MTFLEVIKKVKEVALLVESYGTPVKETLVSLKWIFSALKLEKVNTFIDFVVNTDTTLLQFLLEVIEKVEVFGNATGIKGDDKLAKALTYSHQEFKGVNYMDLFKNGVSILNSFVK